MRHPRGSRRIPIDSSSGQRRRLIPILFSTVLILSFLWVSSGSISAASLAPTISVQGMPSTGTTLAVARAGGASLYDETGKLAVELSSGTALKVTGRTPDNQWFFGSTRDGASGWASASQLVIFGVSNVPVREGFVPPVSGAEATPAAAPAPPASSGAGGLQAVVASGTALNVRSGPGTGYPVIGSLQPGATVMALARNDAADWIQFERSDLPGKSGWASARYLDLNGNAKDLPVAARIAAAPVAPAPKSSAATGLTGKLVFQEQSGGKIYVYDLASGALRPLTTGADPAISPDGQTVAFWRGEGSDYAVYLIDVDGGNERRILARSESLRSPTWSPDGTKIAFSHVVGQRACRYVAYGVCLPDTFPYNLMFGLQKTDTWGLGRVDRNGGSYQDLIAATDALTPDWSERGIFYGGSGVQVTQDVSDESQNQVVLGEYRYQDPAAQPGGDRVIFHSLEKDHWEIFTANADGSNVTALTRPATTLVTPLPHNVAPAWSPDGQHIVFLSNRTGQWKLWVMNPDGSNQRALPVDVPIEYAYQAEQAVSWGK
jgi:Tol biopolymer transport system component/uncharacterized protein YraI